MMDVAVATDAYMTRFLELEKGMNGRAPEWLKDLRRSAIDRFAALGFPTTSQEEWRFTNVAPIARTAFEPAGPAGAGFSVGRIEELTFTAPGVIRMVFVNGRFSRELSSGGPLPGGVRVESLSQAIETRPDEVGRHLGRYARFQNHTFAALNTALIEEGAYVHVPRGVVLEQPVHLVFLTQPEGRPVFTQPRNLVVVEESARLSIVESYLGVAGVYFTNAVTEVVAAENAAVDHYKLQRESLEAYHTGSLEMHASRNAAISNHTISFGGALVRHDVNAALNGEGADCILNGLFVVAGEQHVDNHTGIDHLKPHCTSHELYKGVLDGHARSVFNGRIRVEKDAQKTDSKQTNKNLLLSDDALVNSNPQLEIYADDVKCTHGATIGQLDESAVFYLRSRGIGLSAARHLLTYAFANDVVDRIRIEALRDRLDAFLTHRLRDEDASWSPA